ncbi:MAG TPA: AI-2E family transporter [Ignavibacteriaceae bacterium]|nr:AI-2E family transporter [Ignavibacteriaceae bacterium]
MNKDTYSQKVLFAVGVVVLAAALLILIVEAIQVLLLVFAGILFAVFLRGIAVYISKNSTLSNKVSVALVLFVFIILITGGIWLLGPGIADGFARMREQVPAAWNQLKRELVKSDLGKTIVEGIKNAGENITSNNDLFTRIGGIFTSTFAVMVNVFIILIIGLYTAFNPVLYVNGFIKLFPAAKRQRVSEVLEAMGLALRWWFVGRFASMLIIGILTAVGLWVLNIPMPVTLGIFAAVLTFVPNIGPFVSAVPAVMFGLVISPVRGLYVAVLYVAIQTLESYLITPQIQKKAVSIPPALLISAQILAGILLGFLGLILATPLMVCIIVAVQMIYIEDTLGDSVEILGDGHSSNS